MPEKEQETLSRQLTSLLLSLMASWTGALPRWQYVTDGGHQPTAYFRDVPRRMRHPLTQERLPWEWVIDFFHASGYLTKLGEALYGTTRKGVGWSAKMRRWLRHKRGGIQRVLYSAAAVRARKKLSAGRERDYGKATKGLQKVNPSSSEFCAYGQACIEMARGMFQLLRDHKAVLFASMIPRGTGKVTGGVFEEYLRKDQVFLLERYFYHLERERKNGLLVMDAVEKTADKKFVRQMEAYFVKTAMGCYRTQWIVPTPFFVASDMAYPVQAADLCIYCINWAFRLPTQGMNAPVRDEIEIEFLDWIRSLQFHGDGYREGRVFESWGICFVPNPCGSGRDGEEGA